MLDIEVTNVRDIDDSGRTYGTIDCDGRIYLPDGIKYQVFGDDYVFNMTVLEMCDGERGLLLTPRTDKTYG